MTVESDISENNEVSDQSSRPVFYTTLCDENSEQPIAISIQTENSQSPIIDPTLNRLYDGSAALDAELRDFELKHKDYVHRLDEFESFKANYLVEYNKYKKRFGQLKQEFVQLKNSSSHTHQTDSADDYNKKSNNPIDNTLGTPSTIPNTLKRSSHSMSSLKNGSTSTIDLKTVADNVNKIEMYLNAISDTIPRKDPYLKVILGNVNISILSKNEKLKYKEEYENFKFIITCISLISSLLIWSLTSRHRAFDAMFHFLLVWYYCTLTIRESILVANGSNIHPWWRAHHFISTFATGILLTWPDSPSYHAFRTVFFIFSFYLSFLQGLQFYYQRGCLYRLRALGETNDMEVTMEGFDKWMFRGLSFLVPFLLFGYFFQLYVSIFLCRLAREDTTSEWQVLVLSVIFFCLFLGNLSTTWMVLREKFYERRPAILLKEKYLSFRAFLATTHLYRPIRLRRHRNSISYPELRLKSD